MYTAMYTYKRHGTRKYHGIIRNSRNVGKLSACANSGYQALFRMGLGTSLAYAALAKSATIRHSVKLICHKYVYTVTVQVQIAKFKFRQYQNTAISPNLMPTKFFRYMAYWFTTQVLYFTSWGVMVMYTY